MKINIAKNLKVNLINIEMLMKKEEFINKKPSELPISKKLQQVIHGDVVFSFDLNSLYLTAMSFMKFIYQEIETSSAFTKDMNDGLIKRFTRELVAFKNTEDSTANSGIPKMKFFYLENVIVQYVHVEEKVEKQKVNRLKMVF